LKWTKWVHYSIFRVNSSSPFGSKKEHGDWSPGKKGWCTVRPERTVKERLQKGRHLSPKGGAVDGERGAEKIDSSKGKGNLPYYQGKKSALKVETKHSNNLSKIHKRSTKRRGKVGGQACSEKGKIWFPPKKLKGEKGSFCSATPCGGEAAEQGEEGANNEEKKKHMNRSLGGKKEEWLRVGILS